jgi:predicted nucleic acid-binding protein
MRVLIDTNVLLRSIEPGHAQHTAAARSLATLRQLGHEPVIVPQILYEFWSVATRPIANNGLGMSVSEAEFELNAMKALFRFLRDERAIYVQWETLVVGHEVKGKKAHDTRLVAAMLRHGVANLLTFNVQDFARYPAVNAVLPQDILNGTIAL